MTSANNKTKTGNKTQNYSEASEFVTYKELAYRASNGLPRVQHLTTVDENPARIRAAKLAEIAAIFGE